MINRYVEVTDEYVKQLEHEIDTLKAINEEHKKINGKLREEYNKIQSLYESVFAKSEKQKEVIDKVIKALEIQIEVIKEQPSDNAVSDNFEINQRNMCIKLLNEVSE